MNTTILIISIYAGIITIIAIVFIGLYTYIQSSKIDPKNCPQVKGNYGVTGQSAFQLSNGNLADKSLCGNNGTELCQATARNIGEAIIYCETYSNICNSFVYSILTQTVTIVDEQTGTLTSNNSYDLYQKQF